MKHTLCKKVSSFIHDEDGTAAIELLLCMPILIWALLSTFVYFDAFRAKTISTRASLTIADMISREESPINEAYIDSAVDLLRILTEADDDPDLRITLYEKVGTRLTDPFEVVWSKSRGFGPELTNEDLEKPEYFNRFPVMADSRISILVETRTAYKPPFLVLGPFPDPLEGGTDLNAFTVITPRFQSTVCFAPARPEDCRVIRAP